VQIIIDIIVCLGIPYTLLPGSSNLKIKATKHATLCRLA